MWTEIIWAATHSFACSKQKFRSNFVLQRSMSDDFDMIWYTAHLRDVLSGFIKWYSTFISFVFWMCLPIEVNLSGCVYSYQKCSKDLHFQYHIVVFNCVWPSVELLPVGHWWDYYTGTLLFQLTYCNSLTFCVKRFLYFTGARPIHSLLRLNMDDGIGIVVPTTAVRWHVPFNQYSLHTPHRSSFFCNVIICYIAVIISDSMGLRMLSRGNYTVSKNTIPTVKPLILDAP